MRLSNRFRHVLVRGASMSGKSTIASRIKKKLGHRAVFIGMGGNKMADTTYLQFAQNKLETLMDKKITTHGNLIFFLMQLFPGKLTLAEANIISKSILHGDTFMCTSTENNDFFSTCENTCREKIYNCEVVLCNKIFIQKKFIFEVLHHQMSIQRKCFQNQCFIVDDYEILPFAFSKTIDQFMLNPFNEVFIFTDIFMYPMRNLLESCIKVDMYTSFTLPAGICQFSSNLFKLNYNTELSYYTTNYSASFRNEIRKGDTTEMFKFIRDKGMVDSMTMVYVVTHIDQKQFTILYDQEFAGDKTKRVLHIQELFKSNQKRTPHMNVVIWTDVFHTSTIDTVGQFIHVLNTAATGCMANLFLHNNIFIRFPFVLDYLP